MQDEQEQAEKHGTGGGGGRGVSLNQNSQPDVGATRDPSLCFDRPRDWNGTAFS